MKDITKMPRLFIQNILSLGKTIALTKEQSHYIRNVLRLTMGDFIRVFNGKDGEFLSSLTKSDKMCEITVQNLLKPQTISKGPWLFFSPIKKDRLSFLIEKAVELGVQKLIPVITERTIVRTFNIEKAHLSIIEASEQCERLDVPEILPFITLKDIFKTLKEPQRLYFCKPRSDAPPLRSLSISPDSGILIGPEGGFADTEIAFLESSPQTQAVSLGDRILRAETAAIYALSQISS